MIQYFAKKLNRISIPVVAVRQLEPSPQLFRPADLKEIYSFF